MEPRKQGAILADVGDFHINSTTALLGHPVQLDDGGHYSPSERQAWIWSRFIRYCQLVESVRRRLRLPLWVLLKGELADNNRHKTTQIISRNEADIIEMAVQHLTPLVQAADHVIVLRGTEAHVGPSAWLDEQIARALRDRILGSRLIGDPVTNTASHFIWRGTIGGIHIHAGHHPGAASRVPHTRGNEANRAAHRIFYEYSRINSRLWRAEQAPTGWPDLALFGHNHYPADSKNHHPVRAVITPSWQLNTVFGHRLGGDQLPIGGNIIYCKGPGRYELSPIHYYEPLASFQAGQGEGEPCYDVSGESAGS